MVYSSVSEADDYMTKLQSILEGAKNKTDLQNKIVNAPFSDLRRSATLGLGIVVFLLVNNDTHTIDRIALANTDMARGTVAISAKPFKQIKIPSDHPHNFIARAIRERHYMITSDWQYLFIPALTPEEARFNQAGGGIACSVVYPLNNIDGGGAMIFSYYDPLARISKNHHDFMSRYVALVQSSLKDLSRP